MKFTGDGYLSFALSVSGTYSLRFFARKTEEQSVLAVGSHSLVHKDEDDALTTCVWAALFNKIRRHFKRFFIKKRTETSIADVGMAQCMDALADNVHKQEVPFTQ